MTHVLKSLDQMAQEVYRVELSLFYKTDEFYNEIHVDHKISRRHGKQIVLQVREHCGENGGQEIAVGSIRDGLIKAKGMLTGHEFVIDSLLLLGLDEGDAEIFRAARAEIASILGCSTDSLTQLMTHDEVLSFRAGLLRDALFGILTSGPDGIEAWNSRSSSEFHDAGNDFQGHSVANLDLSEARFEHQDWNKANFDACVLTGCRFGDARISKASFRGADLEGANLSGAEANYADFTGATLSNIFAYEASFKGCKFNNSNLTSAKFDKCDFRAADLREATLKESRFSGCVIDEKTAFDSGSYPEGLVWKGAGRNPLVDLEALTEKIDCHDLASFKDHLLRSLDRAKLTKALQMLKKDSFQLFSDVTADSIEGIVKSQTDPELLYACAISADGKFSCCSQNLNTCGGLKGSLCKHILVLALGLVQAEKIEAGTMALWMVQSEIGGPKLDKDKMTALLLKYKGAESGEVDWRPTETIPEDYYF